MRNAGLVSRPGASRWVALLGSLALVACGHGPSGPGTGTAKVSFELIPSDVACIVINVVGSDGGTTADGGSTFTKAFQVAPQANSTFSLTGLPLGNDTFSAQAYTASEGCPPVTGLPAAYSSNAAVAFVTTNPPVNVTLYMGGTTGEGVVTIDFPVPPGTVTEFPLPDAGSPFGIASGPDGNLWFAEGTANRIGRIATDGGFAEFSNAGLMSPNGIATGPDGSLWITQATSAQLVRMTTGGVFALFNNGSAEGSDGIAAGTDGEVWTTEPAGNCITRMATNGTDTVFSVPFGSPLDGPRGIAAASDGSLWFTKSGSIGRLTTDGGFSEFPLPTPSGAATGIAAGADGNLWFTEYYGNNIGRILVADGGITEFPLVTPDAGPAAVTAGPDGNVWFTETTGNSIGRITPNGTITEFPIPTPASLPAGIAAGPDGNVWFTEETGNKIGRITTL